MQAAELYNRVAARLPDDYPVDPESLTHGVLSALAERLRADEAAELGAELPEDVGDVLLAAAGDGELEREEFIEDLASRLDLDDDDAEVGASAVLVGLRELLETVVEPRGSIEQILE